MKKRKIGPCEVLQKINDNTYMICLPHYIKISDVFNVQHLISYLEEKHNSRTSSFQFRKNDAVRYAIMSGFKQSSMSLPQLDESLSEINYVNGLADTFIDQ